MTRREQIKRERASRMLTYYTNELRGRQDRLKQLTLKGVEALSRYDIEIAYSGDADLALRSSKRMLDNQIRYFEKKMALVVFQGGGVGTGCGAEGGLA